MSIKYFTKERNVFGTNTWSMPKNEENYFNKKEILLNSCIHSLWTHNSFLVSLRANSSKSSCKSICSLLGSESLWTEHIAGIMFLFWKIKEKVKRWVTSKVIEKKYVFVNQFKNWSVNLCSIAQLYPGLYWKLKHYLVKLNFVPPLFRSINCKNGTSWNVWPTSLYGDKYPALLFRTVARYWACVPEPWAIRFSIPIKDHAIRWTYYK